MVITNVKIKGIILIALLFAGLITIGILILNYYKHYHIQKIKVSRVLDGDTVEISNIINHKTKVRLLGIDCYETSAINRAYKQAYENKLTIDEVIYLGNESTEILRTFLDRNKAQIYLQPKGTEKYGRTLGIIYAGDTNINEYMVEYGKCMEFNYTE